MKRRIRGQTHETLKFLVYVGIAYSDEEERKLCFQNARDAVKGNGETLGSGCAIVTKTVRLK